MSNWSLFLDDVRKPTEFPVDRPAVAEGDTKSSVLWAVNVFQAVSYIEMHGMPDTFFLDHDLGPTENTMDFLKIVQARFPNNPPKNVIFLTANPIGKENMRAFISSWRKTA